MKKLLSITIALLTIVSIKTARSQTNEFTQAFDSVFQYIRKDSATTGILYNRVLPFSKFSTGYCSTLSNRDTANADVFFQAYNELRNANFSSNNFLTMDEDSIKALLNNSIIDIGILHFRYNLFNDTVAMQTLYFDADSILREDTSNHNSLYQKMTSLMIYNKIQIF